MNKEEALNEFLKGLRIALNNACAYNKNHPYFKKSAQSFKQKIDELLIFLNPIRVNFSVDSLFVEEKQLDQNTVYLELASLFHLRKIKSLEIKEGVSVEELVEFISSISLPVREILRRGGVKDILQKNDNPHLFIEELDYSQFLGDTGTESRDIWVYFFRQAANKQGSPQAKEFVDNFEKIIGKLKTRDLFEDEELRENLHSFLNYLKEKEKDKFTICTKALFKLVLRDKNISSDESLEKIKLFFQDLNSEDFTDSLWDEILQQEDFNYLSFKVFSRLIGEDGHKQIAPALETKVRNSEALKSNPKLRKRIKELFSMPDPAFVPTLYRNALYSLFESSPLDEEVSFQQNDMPRNYYFILLNLLVQEQDKEKLGLILRLISEKADSFIKERNLEYLKFLLDTLEEKQSKNNWFAPLSEELLGKISVFIENAVFQQEQIPGIEYFIDKLTKSSLGFEKYIENIFDKKVINPASLKLLLKFFHSDLAVVYENIAKKHLDLNFIVDIVRNLEKVDSPLRPEILKKIFYLSSNLMRIEVLRSMQNLLKFDDEFLFTVLEKEDILLKKEALFILSRDKDLLKRALDKLFPVNLSWPKRNKVLMDSLMLIEDLGLIEANDYLLPLTRLRFFWNRSLRKRASEVSEKLKC